MITAALTLLLLSSSSDQYPAPSGRWDYRGFVPFEASGPIPSDSRAAVNALRDGKFGEAYTLFVRRITIDPSDLLAHKGATEAAAKVNKLDSHIQWLLSRQPKLRPGADLRMVPPSSLPYVAALGYSYVEKSRGYRWHMRPWAKDYTSRGMGSRDSFMGRLLHSNLAPLPRVVIQLELRQTGRIGSHVKDPKARARARMLELRTFFPGSALAGQLGLDYDHPRVMQERRKLWRSGINTADQIISEVQNYAPPRFFRALALHRLGQPAEALPEMKRFLALCSGDDGWLVPLAKKCVNSPTDASLRQDDESLIEW